MGGRKSFMSITFLAILVGLLLLDEKSTVNGHSSASITGTVTYLQRIALPPGTMNVQVQLVDISKQDIAAVVLGQQTIPLEHQVPIPFTVSYDPQDIIPTHSYAIQARITELDGTLWFTTTSVYQVITRGYPREDVEIILQMVHSK